MISNYHPPEMSNVSKNSFHLTQLIFLAVSCLFIVCFWIWFFIIRSPVGDVERETIEGRAIVEFLAVCNVSPDAPSEKFRRQDITTRKSSPDIGVRPLVSMLEVSRDGFMCQWDGISPARITQARP